MHLFGPGSITSHVLPSVSGPAAAPTGANTSGAVAQGQPGNAPGAAAYPEPTMGQVMHQMFVVGDPSKTPAQILAPGRAAEHPPATNP